MSGAQGPQLPAAFAGALTRLGAATLGVLHAFEVVARRLHPPLLPELRASFAPLRERLADAVAEARATPVPEPLVGFFDQLRLAADEALQAADGFLAEASPADAAARLLAALSSACRAQEALYPLRTAMPAVARFFTEPPLHDRLAALEPEPPVGTTVGVHVARGPEGGRGGFHLYVPERYRPDRRWPLVVALHGAFGDGRDFLWTWLREARSRGVLLLAPTSHGTTWSMQGADRDGPALRHMVAWVRERWSVDAERVLLTGLSDGGTYALLCGLGADSPFTHVACVAGVLHPSNLSNGNLERARGRPIAIVHGALDWLFPPALARLARDTLAEAGAEVTYREIADLSHTWPREENGRILCWLDPALEPAA